MTRLLAKRFCAPNYAFLSQVRNGSGFQRKTVRTADALAMSLWPSRGIHLNGFEVKVSLSDFKSELAKPEKAEDIGQHCHFWWICAPSVAVAPVELLPPNWGLLVLDKSGDALTVEKHPAINAGAVPPDWLFMAAVLRRASESSVPADCLADYKKEIEDASRAREAQNAQRLTATLGSKAQELLRKEAAIMEIFDDYNQWGTDGFVAKYKLAKAMMTSGGHLFRLFEQAVASAKALSPHVQAYRDATKPTAP